MCFPGCQTLLLAGILKKQRSPSFLCAGAISLKTAATTVAEQAAAAAVQYWQHHLAECVKDQAINSAYYSATSPLGNQHSAAQSEDRCKLAA